MRIVPTLSLSAALALAASVSQAAAPTAAATLAGAGVHGVVTFVASGDAVDVHVVADGLAPGSVHGIHVHETGACTGPDFASAGGHFNPGHQPHGALDHAHHAGDMPSVTADAAGHVDVRFALAASRIDGEQGFIGHSVVLHASADDYVTQPSGNSGARIACGVIAAQ